MDVRVRCVPMIWDNFSNCRKNCAIACGTRAYMLRRFVWSGARKVTFEIFAAFDSQLNTFMSVGILLQYFRGKLLQI